MVTPIKTFKIEHKDIKKKFQDTVRLQLSNKRKSDELTKFLLDASYVK